MIGEEGEKFLESFVLEMELDEVEYLYVWEGEIFLLILLFFFILVVKDFELVMDF